MSKAAAESARHAILLVRETITIIFVWVCVGVCECEWVSECVCE